MNKWTVIITFLAVSIGYAQTPAAVAPPMNLQFLDTSTGTALPCSSCQLYSFTAGTNTPAVTYTDYTGGTPNSNPIVLDTNGYNPAGSSSTGIWFTNCLKFVLQNASAVTIWTIDHVCNNESLLKAGLAATSSTPSSNGAALIGYQQSGTSNNQTVQSALDNINGTQGLVPGIVCDGSTDTHSAIQTALNAAVSAGGGIVQLPPGKVCNLGTVGVILSDTTVGVTLSANTVTGSTLKYSGSGTAVQVGSSVGSSYQNIVGVEIDTSSAGSAAVALSYLSCQYCGVNGVIITSSASAGGSTQSGLVFNSVGTASQHFRWVNTLVTGTFRYPVLLEASVEANALSNSEFVGGGVNCLTPRSGQIGFYVSIGTNNTWVNPSFQNCSIGLRWSDENNWAFNPYFSGNTTDFSAPAVSMGIQGALYSGFVGGNLTTASIDATTVNPYWSYVGTLLNGSIKYQVPNTISTGVNTATFSTTPNFDMSLGNVQVINLTGNVTSWTVSNVPSGVTRGGAFSFIVCQDATGSRTMSSPPAAVHGFMTIGGTANTCSSQSFAANNGVLEATGAGVTNE